MVYDAALQYDDDAQNWLLFHGTKLLFPRFTLRALTTSGVLNRAVLNRHIVAYQWRVAQPAEISYAEIRHASRAPGEVVKVNERKKREVVPGQCRGSDRVNQGHSRWIDFNMVLRPCLMTRKLVRPTANRDTLTEARHHSIFRNTSG